MKRKISAAIITVLLSVFILLPATVHAATPAIMSSLKSYIETYGPITGYSANGSNIYVSKISYESKNKRFLFECGYTNGNSTQIVKMYMPTAKKQTSYTVYFSQVVRASGLTAKISGKASLKRKTYSDASTNLKFSRTNGTAAAKKIKGSAYQAAANAMLKIAFKFWERGLETGPTLCFRNFGFNRITVMDGNIYAKEWK